MLKNYSNKFKWVEKLEWYVLDHDFNKNEIQMWNIFHSCKFANCVKQCIDKYTDYKSFKDQLTRDLTWCFWAKAEYEIIAGGLFAKEDDDFFKIDIYEQVKPNVDILAKYIITEANKHKRKKLVIE